MAPRFSAKSSDLSFAESRFCVDSCQTCEGRLVSRTIELLRALLGFRLRAKIPLASSSAPLLLTLSQQRKHFHPVVSLAIVDLM